MSDLHNCIAKIGQNIGILERLVDIVIDEISTICPQDVQERLYVVQKAAKLAREEKLDK